MNYNQAVEYVLNLGLLNHKPGFERMNIALKELNADNKFGVIHVAGTNGKGSVCAFVSGALSNAGVKTGLFISPHIFDIRERIQINGEKISKKDFAVLASRISGVHTPLSMFEFLTLMAFMYFNENGVEIAVLETGLGGRLDATNVAKNKKIAVITKIDLDHEKILGSTVEEIAAEKCGIINCEKTVCAPGQSAAVLNVIKRNAETLIVPNKKDLKIERVSTFGNTFYYKGEEYKTDMGGEHQVENALTAIETLKNLGINISDIKAGLESAFMPARLQTVKTNPPVIVDGAHNPNGAGALFKTLKTLEDFTAIIGFMRDKDYKKVLSLTLPTAGSVICVNANDSKRSLSAEELFETAKAYNNNCSYSNDLKKAINTAIKKGNPVVIFGSLYLASNALKILENDN